MQSPVYLLIWIAAACAAYLIWSLGIKKLLLDGLRERLFELRFELFSMGMAKELDYDDPAYRSVEAWFCGLLRFAHRISFLTYVVSAVELHQALRDKDYVDVSNQLNLKLSRLQPPVRDKVLNIREQGRRALMLYLVLSSLPMCAVVGTLLALKYMGIVTLKDAKEKVTSPIEREAYRYESRHRRLGQLAVA